MRSRSRLVSLMVLGVLAGQPPVFGADHSALRAPDAQTARVRLVVQSSPIAGFRHAEGSAVWPDLRTGDELALVRERDNAFDENAVRVEWRGRKLGYVPRRDNAALAWALDRGEALRARISRLEWHRNPARRVAFEVFVE